MFDRKVKLGFVLSPQRRGKSCIPIPNAQLACALKCFNDMTQRRIYQTDFPYLVSTNTYRRQNFFENTHFAAELYDTILEVSKNLNCTVYVFGIMPDHLHFLLKTTSKMTVSKVLQQIKSIFTKNLREKYNFNKPIWQRRFNSRIVDSEERLRNTIEYILHNPIKAGLDKKYQRKPYIYLNRKAIDSLFG